MKPIAIVTAFIPMVAFSLLTTAVGAGWAAVIAMGAAVAVMAATSTGGIKILPIAQTVILLAMAVLAFTGGPPVDHVLVRYGPALHGLLVGLFIVATAATIPFTAQYARTTVPAEVWHTRRFLEVNQRISTAWGLAILFHGMCHLAGAEIPVSGWHLALRLAVNWVLPLGGFWLAVSYTQRTARAAQHAAKDAHPASERDASETGHVPA